MYQHVNKLHYSANPVSGAEGVWQRNKKAAVASCCLAAIRALHLVRDLAPQWMLLSGISPCCSPQPALSAVQRACGRARRKPQSLRAAWLPSVPCIRYEAALELFTFLLSERLTYFSCAPALSAAQRVCGRAKRRPRLCPAVWLPSAHSSGTRLHPGRL